MLNFCGASDFALFCNDYKGWVAEALQNGRAARDSLWTESIAVGSEGFIHEMKEKMGVKAKGRQIRGIDDKYTLREPGNSYITDFDPESCPLRLENKYLWDVYNDSSAR